MGKLLLSTLCVFVSMVAAIAQNTVSISGLITDRDTKEAVMMVTVQVLNSDSTFIKGVLSDEHGKFSVDVPQNHDYILRLTSVGYTTLTKNVKVGSETVNLETVVLGADAIMLKEATVVGQAVKVTVKEDTFVYNAAAYRTPEGSVVEELVKRLPGAKVDDEGNITVNGKEVKKILVDGKEFMTGDTKTALKNLPTSIIDKIKAYEEKSDLAKVTGIDDGEEQTVLDFGIKKGMNKGFLSNSDFAIGTHQRYAERLMAGLFQDQTKVFVMGNANNTNDKGFPGGGGGGNFGGGRQGLNANKMLGVNFNHEPSDKLKLNGSVRWNHADGDTRTEQSAENFVSNTGSFSNSLNQQYSRSDGWNARMRLEWKPDSMTNILFRPQFSYTKSDGRSAGMSATYKEDPYKYVTDPLATASFEQLDERGLMVNTRNNTSITYGENKMVSGMLQYNRKLSTTGRNFTLRGDISYTDKESQNLSTSDVHLYQTNDIYQTNRYYTAPVKTFKYSLQATYSEPIFKATFLQTSYKFTYQNNKTDRTTYDFSNMGEGYFGALSGAYRSWNDYFAMLPLPLSEYIDTDLTRSSSYANYIHDIQLMLRVIRSKYTMNVGVMVQPQQTHFKQSYQNIDTIRNVVNVSPTLDFRYRFSKVSNLRINYRGSTSQPSMTDLLDIRDDSDPLNVTTGNPGLKPSFTNSFRLYYNTYLEKHQQSIMTSINYSNTRNSISNKVTYIEETGGRITRPENINGNWDFSGTLMFNTAIDSTGYWSVSTFTNGRYNNYVGFLSTGDEKLSSVKNTTRTTEIGEQLSLNFRNSWLEVVTDGSLTYTHTRNLLQAQNNMNTWQFAYGASLNVYLPWGSSISTDMHNNCRRGYNDSSMNTNELIWNAQISHSFLKGKALTMSLQFYDILKKQSNFSRTINAMQRSDTKYNSVNSYAMLHVVYRLNLFGGKQPQRDNNRGERTDFNRPEPGQRMPQGGTRGGFGDMPPRRAF